MVYTLMPNFSAISAAVSGGTIPLLFTPSVSKIITLDIASESFNRFTAVANPIPIAVPSSTIPLLTSWNKLISTLWSVVSGHWVKLSPAKITKPTRSFIRLLMKSIATFLEASNRSGFKSCASILPEISIAKTISIPFVVLSSQLVEDCGRAKAIIIKVTAAIFNTKGKWRNCCFIVGLVSIASVPENKIKEIVSKIKSHIDLHESHEKELIKIENIDQVLALNNFLTAENKKLRELIDESINSEEIFARVLIDRESPFLKSIVLNRGSKDNVKIGMAIMDRNYLVGQVIEVNYSNSRALLLSDLNSKIPVIVQPPYLQAVASGTGKDYGVIEYTKDEYEENQIENKVIVYTSGLGGLFKPGIPVGKIINNSGQIEFFSDFGQLSFVKIIEFKIGEDK